MEDLPRPERFCEILPSLVICPLHLDSLEDAHDALGEHWCVKAYRRSSWWQALHPSLWDHWQLLLPVEKADWDAGVVVGP